MINKINTFLRMGDHTYSLMRETYTIYTNNYEPPLIEKFYPFEGGPPPERYTENFSSKNESDSPQKESRIIIVDFQERKRILNSLRPL